jgi:DNA-binding CsgD family transcriptional regulator
MLKYDTLAAMQIVSAVKDQLELGAALQTMAQSLGCVEAIYVSKHGFALNSMAVEVYAPEGSLLSSMLAHNKMSLAMCAHTYRLNQQNCWVQTIAFDAHQQQDSQYLLHFCFVQGMFQQGLVVCLYPTTGSTAELIYPHEPYLLHMNHLIGQKLAHIRQKTQIAHDQTFLADCPLSKRELEVLRWTADGKTAEEISQLLSITPRTVNFHMAQMMNVLGSPNKTSIVSKAMIRGWLFE